MTKVGVVAVQGDVLEHVEACRAALSDLGQGGDVVEVRRPDQLREVHALVIPGGESTTIGHLLDKFGLRAVIEERADPDGGAGDLAIMGTCAGCILLAKKGDAQVEETATPLLGLMDMAVDRNAFGRQRDSFEATLDLDESLGIGAFPAVFIRAPAIRETWGECRPLGRFDDRVVLAEQGPHMALAFHPELTGDVRLHRRFLERI